MILCDIDPSSLPVPFTWWSHWIHTYWTLDTEVSVSLISLPPAHHLGEQWWVFPGRRAPVPHQCHSAGTGEAVWGRTTSSDGHHCRGCGMWLENACIFDPLAFPQEKGLNPTKLCICCLHMWYFLYIRVYHGHLYHTIIYSISPVHLNYTQLYTHSIITPTLFIQLLLRWIVYFIKLCNTGASRCSYHQIYNSLHLVALAQLLSINTQWFPPPCWP